jgi:CDP-diacylglycerol--serine O-phosphatidyltransferase
MIKKKRKFRKKQERKKRTLSLEFFPSLFSLLNAFFGFLGIIETMKGKYETSAILILLSWLMDIMDGLIARTLKATSQLGIQLDSLSDSVSFGIAPSLLIYSFYLRNVPQGWIIPFLYSAAGILRLARYNVIAINESERHSYFVGLPIPASAILISGIVLLFRNRFSGPLFYGVLSIVLLILSFLMISKIKYPNSKYFQLMKRRNTVFIFILSFLIAIAYVAPHFVVLSLVIPYILFPLFIAFNNYLKRKSLREEVIPDQSN